MYDSSQARRSWYIESVQTKRLDLSAVADEPRLFHGVFAGTDMLLVIHVDDALLAAVWEEALEQIKEEFKKSFKMKDFGPVRQVLGLEVSRHGERGRQHAASNMMGRGPPALRMTSGLRPPRLAHVFSNHAPNSAPVCSAEQLSG